MISIQIIFFVPEIKDKKIHFICVGFGEDRCTAHNACMFSAQRALAERMDNVRAKEAADFCHVARRLVNFPSRETITIGNVMAIVTIK